MSGRHRRALEGWGLAPEAVEALDAYLAAVEEWSRAVNLTAATDPESRAAVLVQAVLGAAALIEGRSLLDVGSGNGSPGLVLAALRPDVQTTLLEPRARRWAFLREAARRMGRPDIGVERRRVEDHMGVADTVSVRALTLRPEVLSRVCAPGGRLLVIGRPVDPSRYWRSDGGEGPIHAYRRST